MTGSPRWQDGTNFLLGAWLVVAPVASYASGANGAAAWNSYLCGIMIMLLTAGALARQSMWQEWTNLIVGVWLLLAPWIIGFIGTDGVATVNHIFIGIIVGVTALSVVANG